MMEDFSDLLDDDIELAEPLAKRDRKRKRASRWIGCPLPWLQWVYPRVTGKRQLLLALMLYRRCCQCKSATITVQNEELTRFRIDRSDKSRMLQSLLESGVLKRMQRQCGRRAIKVTLAEWHGDSSSESLHESPCIE